MTHSYFELPKDPFSANDNFQELEMQFFEVAECEDLPISRDSSTVGGPELQLRPQVLPSMVSGAPGAEHHSGGVSPSSGTHRYANWTTKTKIGRRKVTRCLSLAQVKDAQSAWHHARSIGQPMNVNADRRMTPNRRHADPTRSLILLNCNYETPAPIDVGTPRRNTR
ncbi:hypothetical protein GCM10010987_60690 [Bradyrhizobium guangdongense]|uniref:Uncharacterized protein n=1 Tax=Bradyrhizobium guangdongense TaxID=1325090 RepID=A0AA87WA96_9BRAD|nr:hypothetical protein GCM10010987_60690 [Bradyrhizobium guangdongense]